MTHPCERRQRREYRRGHDAADQAQVRQRLVHVLQRDRGHDGAGARSGQVNGAARKSDGPVPGTVKTAGEPGELETGIFAGSSGFG